MRLFKKQQPFELQPRRRPAPVAQSIKPKQAFSYYAKRSLGDENTGRGRGDRSVETTNSSAGTASIWQNSKIRLGLALLAGLFGMYLFTLSTTPKIVFISPGDSKVFLREEAVYKQASQVLLRNSVLNRNKLTIDTNSIILGLREQFPEIQQASVVTPLLGQTPIVYIEASKPSFILATEGSNAFLLDPTGRALAAVNQIPDTSKLVVPTIQDQSNRKIAVGQRVLSSTTISFTTNVLQALSAKGVKTSSLIMPAAKHELDVYIANKPYFVKFNLSEDALQQAGTFLAAKKRLEADKVQPSLYIDVRVPERVYYK